jgi:hypothetical protein
MVRGHPGNFKMYARIVAPQGWAKADISSGLRQNVHCHELMISHKSPALTVVFDGRIAKGRT